MVQTSEGFALARELIDAGLLNPAAVVESDVVVRDVSRRNRNLLVSIGSGSSFFVKFASSTAADRPREADRYRSLGRRPPFAEYVPTIVRDDRGALVIASPADAVDLWTYHRTEERYPIEVGSEIGRALGLLHRETRLLAATAGSAPWILSIHRPSVDSLREHSPASIELIKLIQWHPPFGTAFDELRAGWRAEALTHGDIKWSNLVVVPSSGASPPVLRIVDWEHASEGDPAWDIGSALAGYLTPWLSSITLPPGEEASSRIAEGARVPLEDLQPALGACWAAYVEAAGLGPSGARDLLTRAVRLAAARLVQNAYEATQSTSNVGVSVAVHLQAAASMLERPMAAAHDLMGLPRAAQADDE